jgi:hypothetical protein
MRERSSVKQRLEPSCLESVRERGVPRMPDGVRCFIDGTRGAESINGPFPYPRFWCWIELACDRLVRDGEPEQCFVTEIQVKRLYSGVVPWLAYGMGDAAAIQRATDLVCLLDELMYKEDELYRYCVAWPMADLLAVLADVAATAAGNLTWDMLLAWGNESLMDLAKKFIEVRSALAEHEDCCAEALINVHWW